MKHAKFANPDSGCFALAHGWAGEFTNAGLTCGVDGQIEADQERARRSRKISRVSDNESIMYVLIVFDRYEDNTIDAVLGPFDSLETAQDKRHDLFGHTYRQTTIQKVTSTLPEWAE